MRGSASGRSADLVAHGNSEVVEALRRPTDDVKEQEDRADLAPRGQPAIKGPVVGSGRMRRLMTNVREDERFILIFFFYTKIIVHKYLQL